MPSPSLLLRRALPEDQKLIETSWFESYRRGGCALPVGFDLYKPGQDRVIKRCLKDGWSQVAYAAASPDEICGWLVGDALNVLHYVYVKQAYRRLGVASLLLEKAFKDQPNIQHTHETRVFRGCLQAKLKARFNPYLLFK